MRNTYFKGNRKAFLEDLCHDFRVSNLIQNNQSFHWKRHRFNFYVLPNKFKKEIAQSKTNPMRAIRAVNSPLASCDSIEFTVATIYWYTP